jgi:hypothetical protein
VKKLTKIITNTLSNRHGTWQSRGHSQPGYQYKLHTHHQKWCCHWGCLLSVIIVTPPRAGICYLFIFWSKISNFFVSWYFHVSRFVVGKGACSSGLDGNKQETKIYTSSGIRKQSSGKTVLPVCGGCIISRYTCGHEVSSSYMVANDQGGGDGSVWRVACILYCSASP